MGTVLNQTCQWLEFPLDALAVDLGMQIWWWTILLIVVPLVSIMSSLGSVLCYSALCPVMVMLWLGRGVSAMDQSGMVAGGAMNGFVPDVCVPIDTEVLQMVMR